MDAQRLEVQADVRGAAGFLRCHDRVRPTLDLDRLHIQRLDFEIAGEELERRPGNLRFAGAKPDAVVVDKGEIGQRRGLQRVALQAGDADDSQRPELAAVDLRDDEGAATVAGDPVPQPDAHRDEHEDCR